MESIAFTLQHFLNLFSQSIVLVMVSPLHLFTPQLDCRHMDLPFFLGDHVVRSVIASAFIPRVSI